MAVSELTFYRPVGDDDEFESVKTIGKVRQGSRGDFEESGGYAKTGGVVVEVDSSLNVRQGWYLAIAGQQFRIEGEAPIPPFFVRTRIEAVPNGDEIAVLESLSVGESALTVEDVELSVTTKERIGR